MATREKIGVNASGTGHAHYHDISRGVNSGPSRRPGEQTIGRDMTISNPFSTTPRHRRAGA
ncbi:hypothetical protein J2T09_001895 [Neorhizobium huautlense]|uniref:Uncharacterized protein n=1 Tax=Neorhizobium huautlense TaxID=67774 RepID=A0ABT9PRQ2_9HYPH|nr:hypothetical protein [Neorhizobium huautlense]